MSVEADPGAGPGQPVRTATAVQGGPLPLTMRQGAIAAILVLVVGLGIALLTPVAAAVEARRVTPPGAVVVGQAAVLPADGWAVQQAPDGSAVLLARAGARMIVRWQPGTPPDATTGLQSLAQSTQQDVPDASRFGGARRFTSPSGDPGLLAPFAAPGSTGAIAVVTSSQGEATVQALAPTTTFSQVSEDLVNMITSIRIRRGASS